MKSHTVIEKNGVVIEHNGEFWGVQYEDGHSTNEWWGPIEKATIGRPRIKSPTDLTWKGSPYIEELKKGKLKKVKRKTIFFVEE